MKGKHWAVVLVIVTFLGCAFGFREVLAVRLFPKAVLTRAIGDLAEDLQARYAKTPWTLFSGALDPAGRCQAHIKLDSETRLMGIAHYDLELQAQMKPNRVSGHGTVSTGTGLLDLNFYLDEKSAALESPGLTEGNWYGIRYESFPAEIREFQLLGVLLGDELLSSWDESVAELAALMRRNYSLPKLNAMDLRTALLSTLALRPLVEREEGENCFCISFSTRGDELAQKAQPYLNQLPEDLAELVRSMGDDPDSGVSIVFHLANRTLAGIDASVAFSRIAYDMRLTLEGKILQAELSNRDGQKLDRWILTQEISEEEGICREKLLFDPMEDGTEDQFSVEYAWNQSTGDMVLEVIRAGREYPVRLNLRGEGQSVFIVCRNFEQVFSLITGKDEKRPAICAVTISPGEPVPPIDGFKSLGDWSVEDLYLLFTRLGSLVKLKMP